MKDLKFIAALSFSLIFPSVGQVYKYFHILGLLLYVVGVPLTLIILKKYFLRRFFRVIDFKKAWLLFGATFLFLIALFFIIYPIVDSGVIGGGSDTDDALDVAVSSLLSGHYPYYARNYLDNEVTQLPGKIFLAIPFVLLGRSAYQNIFWIAALFVFLTIFFKDPRHSLILIWVLLFLSPGVMQAFLTGSAMLANGIYIMIFTLLLYRSASGSKSPNPACFAYAVLLGIGLSSAINFLLIAPVLFAGLARQRGIKCAIQLLSVSLLTFLAVTTPFYLFDPAHFPPFTTTNVFKWTRPVVPHARLVMPLICAAFSLFIAARCKGRSEENLLVGCAFTQLIPITLLMGIVVFVLRDMDKLPLFGYGLIFVFFMAPALWLRLISREGLFKSFTANEISY